MSSEIVTRPLKQSVSNLSAFDEVEVPGALATSQKSPSSHGSVLETESSFGGTTTPTDSLFSIRITRTEFPSRTSIDVRQRLQDEAWEEEHAAYELSDASLVPLNIILFL